MVKMKQISTIELLAAQSDEPDIRAAAVSEFANRMLCLKTLF